MTERAEHAAYGGIAAWGVLQLLALLVLGLAGTSSGSTELVPDPDYDPAADQARLSDPAVPKDDNPAADQARLSDPAVPKDDNPAADQARLSDPAVPKSPVAATGTASAPLDTPDAARLMETYNGVDPHYNEKCICLENIDESGGNDLTRATCGHCYHKACAEEWIRKDPLQKSSCCFCRKENAFLGGPMKFGSPESKEYLQSFIDADKITRMQMGQDAATDVKVDELKHDQVAGMLREEGPKGLVAWLGHALREPLWEEGVLLSDTVLGDKGFAAVAAVASTAFPKMTRMEVWDTGIKEIPESLNDLTKLESLELSYNEISVIPESLDLPELEYLHLTYNQIREFPESLDLPELVYLPLMNNEIEKFPASLNLPNLYNLYICHNPITKMPDNLDSWVLPGGQDKPTLFFSDNNNLTDDAKELLNSKFVMDTLRC